MRRAALSISCIAATLALTLGLEAPPVPYRHDGPWAFLGYCIAFEKFKHRM